jgi:hypothetical protein
LRLLDLLAHAERAPSSRLSAALFLKSWERAAQTLEVHPEAEYELALGARELAGGEGEEVGLQATSWVDFNTKGMWIPGAHVRFREVIAALAPPCVLRDNLFSCHASCT